MKPTSLTQTICALIGLGGLTVAAGCGTKLERLTRPPATAGGPRAEGPATLTVEGPRQGPADASQSQSVCEKTNHQPEPRPSSSGGPVSCEGPPRTRTPSSPRTAETPQEPSHTRSRAPKPGRPSEARAGATAWTDGIRRSPALTDFSLTGLRVGFGAVGSDGPRGAGSGPADIPTPGKDRTVRTGAEAYSCFFGSGPLRSKCRSLCAWRRGPAQDAEPVRGADGRLMKRKERERDGSVNDRASETDRLVRWRGGTGVDPVSPSSAACKAETVGGPMRHTEVNDVQPLSAPTFGMCSSASASARYADGNEGQQSQGAGLGNYSGGDFHTGIGLVCPSKGVEPNAILHNSNPTVLPSASEIETNSEISLLSVYQIRSQGWVGNGRTVVPVKVGRECDRRNGFAKISTQEQGRMNTPSLYLGYARNSLYLAENIHVGVAKATCAIINSRLSVGWQRNIQVEEFATGWKPVKMSRTCRILKSYDTCTSVGCSDCQKYNCYRHAEPRASTNTDHGNLLTVGPLRQTSIQKPAAVPTGRPGTRNVKSTKSGSQFQETCPRQGPEIIQRGNIGLLVLFV